MIVIKTPKEIAIMHEGGKRLRKVLDKVLANIYPGANELALDRIAQDEIEHLGGKPSFQMVPGYHHATCLTVNQEVVHGIPKAGSLKEGDILGVDLGMFYKGYHTDLAISVGVGKISRKKEEFLKVGREALDLAISAACAGNFLGDISWEIQKKIESFKYHPVRALTGHGVGQKLHEDPSIPCVLEKIKERTTRIKVGMTLAIEVIYNQGSDELVLEKDGWTISTWDGKISGLFEETVAVTQDGPLILTR